MVDDGAAEHFLARAVVSHSGLNVELISVYDGQEAIETLSSMEAKPDLILLDINMPRMDGHEFLEAYAKTNASVPPVVAMLTSSNSPKDRERAVAHSCVIDYLVKPITVEKLRKLSSALASLGTQIDSTIA